jgi:hypothetical protein
MEGEKEGYKTLDLKYRFKDLARVKVENIIVVPKRTQTVFWHQGLLRLMFCYRFFLFSDVPKRPYIGTSAATSYRQDLVRKPIC